MKEIGFDAIRLRCGSILKKAGAERGEESHIDNKIRMTYLEIHPYAC